MFNLLDHPILILAASLVVSWIAASIGGFLGRGRRDSEKDHRDEFMFLLGGTLTLLGLIIGFTFSMAVNRYDQRKNYEEEEANAIGTEYVRADLLPAADGTKVRALLKDYLDQRILHYQAGSLEDLRQLDARTAQLQAEMWAAVAKPGANQLSPVTALAVSGMNDVLNAQGYTQAAWWNRIPLAAWLLMAAISVFCNVLVGYAAHGNRAVLFMILPVALSISLYLIADIDSPRGGLIRVHPQNLEALAASLRSG